MKRVASLASLASLALAACGPALPVPEVGSHLGDDPVSVPSMPPPGRVEIIPPQPPPPKKTVWIDGEWEWGGRRWQWKEGRWEEPKGDTFAPAITVRMSDGSIVHFKGTWKKNAQAPAP